MELVEKRRVGRPKTTMVGIAERIERTRRRLVTLPYDPDMGLHVLGCV
jgi:hypothetical protein